MDDFDLYEYVEEVSRGLTPLDHGQTTYEDVVFFDDFQPFQRAYSVSEVKENYHVEAEKRGIVPDLLEFENFFLPKRALLDRIRAAKKKGLTKEQAKWTRITAMKIRDREIIRKLSTEVQELHEGVKYASKKNTEIKKIIKENEEVVREGFKKISFLNKFNSNGRPDGHL